MHNFRYVSKREAAPAKAVLLDIIHTVQEIVRDKFTFQYSFVGSASRNMITCDEGSNIGYDFDVNIEVNDDEEEYSAKEIRNILRNAFDRVVTYYGYGYCEDSTRVLTIKVKDQQHSRILHSCDFCIVNNCEDGRQQYIRFNKVQQSYSWEYQGKAFDGLGERIDWLRENDYWQETRDYYIDKKNENDNPDKHSRSIFAETVNEMCQKKGYYD